MMEKENRGRNSCLPFDTWSIYFWNFESCSWNWKRMHFFSCLRSRVASEGENQLSCPSRTARSLHTAPFKQPSNSSGGKGKEEGTQGKGKLLISQQNFGCIFITLPIKFTVSQTAAFHSQFISFPSSQNSNSLI